MRAPKDDTAHKPQWSIYVYKRELLFPVLVFLHKVAEFEVNITWHINFHSDFKSVGHLK
jgi:hypothetical protein